MSAAQGAQPLPSGTAHIDALILALGGLRQRTSQIDRWGAHLADVLVGGGRLLAAGNGGGFPATFIISTVILLLFAVGFTFIGFSYASATMRFFSVNVKKFFFLLTPTPASSPAATTTSSPASSSAPISG